MDHAGELAIVGGLSALAGAAMARWWAVPADERLLGTWQSDGERTVNEWREIRQMTDEQTAALRKMFGHMRITWGRRACVTDMDGRQTELSYKVVAKDENSVVIRGVNTLSDREEFVILHFVDADTYWLYAAGGPLKEYFRRVV